MTAPWVSFLLAPILHIPRSLRDSGIASDEVAATGLTATGDETTQRIVLPETTVFENHHSKSTAKDSQDAVVSWNVPVPLS